MPRQAARVLRNVACRVALEAVAAQHGQAGSHVAQQDHQVNDPCVLPYQGMPVAHGEDPAVGELDALRLVRPAGRKDGTLPGQQGPLCDPGATSRGPDRDERGTSQDVPAAVVPMSASVTQAVM
jgi:hypothetical protein